MTFPPPGSTWSATGTCDRHGTTASRAGAAPAIGAASTIGTAVRPPAPAARAAHAQRAQAGAAGGERRVLCSSRRERPARRESHRRARRPARGCAAAAARAMGAGRAARPAAARRACRPGRERPRARARTSAAGESEERLDGLPVANADAVGAVGAELAAGLHAAEVALHLVAQAHLQRLAERVELGLAIRVARDAVQAAPVQVHGDAEALARARARGCRGRAGGRRARCGFGLSGPYVLGAAESSRPRGLRRRARLAARWSRLAGDVATCIR